MERGSNEEIHATLEWIKRELKDTADYAHKAMWFATAAACFSFVLVLRAGGYL